MYTCPCCGHEVFESPPGSFDICPICFWEDDFVQLYFPLQGGGAKRAQLDDKRRKFLSQLMGRLTLTFTAKSVALEMPDWEVEANDGEKSHFKGFKEVHPYKMLGHTNSSIAVLSLEPVSGAESITVYNFDDENTMWVYTGGAGKAFPSEHLREYFVRLR